MCFKHKLDPRSAESRWRCESHGKAGQTVVIVPGANLIVLYSSWEGGNALICLDTSSAKHLDIIPVGKWLQSGSLQVSHPYEERETFMVAVATGQQRGTYGP